MDTNIIYSVFVCLITGYLVGCINPAWIISKVKKADLNQKGTQNLGATNAFIILGKGTGVFVMLFDIVKAFIAIKISEILFPLFAAAGAITGTAVIIGHIFPFYLGFRGGKGLACLGGTVLGLDWKLFLPILFTGVIVAFITNYACALSFSAATLFPIAYGVRIQSLANFFIVSVSAICISIKHMENIHRIRNGTEMSIRDYFSRNREA